MNHAAVGSGSVLETYFAVFALCLAVLIPLTAIVICILCSPKSSNDATELGLGNATLHDEFWDFISDFERGEVTMETLDADQTIGVLDERADSKNSYLP